MDIKLKQKLLTASPFGVIEKIVGNSHKVTVKLFAWGSSIAGNLRSNETSEAGGQACMHGSRLFRYVRVNYDYLKRFQPKLY